ncbi:MAG: hypothetical protein ACFNUU_00335 [Campylobacter sp.]|uniref:hypothetical protein n=1 Tax=Campylobacter sp. TaxID=205 RepID=UPI00361EF2EE
MPRSVVSANLTKFESPGGYEFDAKFCVNLRSNSAPQQTAKFKKAQKGGKMLDEILDDEKFSAMMKEHVFECIEYLLKNDRSFSAMANLDLVKFDPELPEYISSTFTAPVIVFTLAGYTFSSAKLTPEELSFEAGFGKENFASIVSFPLGAIVQILVENSPILVNFSVYKTQKSQLEKSMSALMSNPNNKDLFKK